MSENSNLQKNEQKLENDKYNSNGDPIKINLNNVIWKGRNIINSIYNIKYKNNKNTFKSYNYYAPLDDSPKEKKTRKTTQKYKMTTNFDEDDIQTLNILNDYVNDLTTEVLNSSWTDGDKGAWEEVGKKQKDKIKLAINKQNLNRFLPRYLMPGKAEGTAKVKTTKQIPITIKIRAPEGTKAHFNQSRILVALMKALQSLYYDTYIGPINNNKDDYNSKILYEPSDVSADEKELEDYIEVGGDLRQFMGKVVLLTNNELVAYKISPVLRCYLAKENMVIDKNELTSINPPNIGFLETVVPRNETVQLHTARLMKKLPSNIPKFQLSVSSLYVKPGTRCRILMLRADLSCTLRNTVTVLTDSNLLRNP
jgi:hypothetical protein